MSDEKSSRSRTAWASPATADYADLYRTKRRVHFLLILAILVLALAVGTLTFFVYQQQQYVEGKGEQRDRERIELEERLDRAMCDLLDTFPAGIPGLERPRAKYGCGPGIPIDQLTPGEQAQLRARPPVEPAAEPVAPTSPAPFSGGAPISPAPQADTFRAPN